MKNKILDGYPMGFVYYEETQVYCVMLSFADYQYCVEYKTMYEVRKYHHKFKYIKIKENISLHEFFQEVSLIIKNID